MSRLCELDKTFNVYESSVGIWRTSTAEDWETYEAIRMMMVRDGFSFHQDPHTKKYYRSIARMHHCGNKGDLHFFSKICGRHIEIEFYEDVIRDNKNGGRYHFDKLAKMPYLRRLKALLALRKITAFLTTAGYTDQSKRYSNDALENVMQRRKEIMNFQRANFYEGPREAYNATDADGRMLADGQVRYFWTSNGRLGRGVVYHNLNNMWWVVCNGTHFTNQASFRLFQWGPEMGRKRQASQNQIEHHLAKLVKAEKYESAIVLRNQLRATAATA